MAFLLLPTSGSVSNQNLKNQICQFVSMVTRTISGSLLVAISDLYLPGMDDISTSVGYIEADTPLLLCLDNLCFINRTHIRLKLNFKIHCEDAASWNIQRGSDENKIVERISNFIPFHWKHSNLDIRQVCKNFNLKHNGGKLLKCMKP